MSAETELGFKDLCTLIRLVSSDDAEAVDVDTDVDVGKTVVVMTLCGGSNGLLMGMRRVGFFCGL